MAISLISSRSFRLVLALGVSAFAACSAADDDERPGDGSEQIGGQTGGSDGGEAVEGPAGAAGSDSAEPSAGGVGSGMNPTPGGTSSMAGETGAGEPVGGGGGSGFEPEPAPPSEAFLRGEALVKKNECATCHQANFAGFTVFPNITPDEATGIGTWSDEQIIAAIRDGIDADGSSLCKTMMRYSFTDDEALDIVAFLRGIPAVSRKSTSVCPGHGE